MKNILFGSAILIASLVSGIVDATERNYSLALTKPDQPAIIDIELYRGSVSVIGYEGKTVEISANLSPIVDDKESEFQKKIQKKIKNKVKNNLDHHQLSTHRSTEGLKLVKSEMFHLEVEEENNEIEIVSQTVNQHVALVIKVPFSASVAVEVYQGGNIDVNNVKGSLELKSYQGGISAMNISGPIVAETYTQDIVVEFNHFDEKTPTSLTSHTGNLDVTLAKNINAMINVQTYQGEVFSGLDSEFTSVDEVKNGTSNTKQKITLGGILQAKLNKGGQDLSMTTYIGNLYIRKAK